MKFGGELPEAAWAMFKNQLDAIAAPRRRHLTDTHHHPADTDEELSAGQRLGRAFCAWIERIPTHGLPTTGGTPATITWGHLPLAGDNLDYDTLKSEVVAATLANGTRISATELRRLACGANILPRVLGGKSEAVDQGRAKRLFTPAQRLALADRDRGCTYAGCDRPPGWAEAHHLDWWARDGGNTNLNDGARLCARHHHQVHEHNIDGRVQDGHVQWRLNGIWQTNHRWRT